MRTRLATGAALAAAVVLAGSALAAPALTARQRHASPAAPPPLTGTAAFADGPTGPVPVGGHRHHRLAPRRCDAFNAAGVDLQGATIEETGRRQGPAVHLEGAQPPRPPRRPR